MKEIVFKQSTSDLCVFVRSRQELEILAVYVDDLIFITESTESVDELKQPFKKRYKMKDMGSCPISWTSLLSKTKQRTVSFFIRSITLKPFVRTPLQPLLMQM